MKVSRRQALAGLVAAPAFANSPVTLDPFAVADRINIFFHGTAFFLAHPDRLEVLVPEMGTMHSYKIGHQGIPASVQDLQRGVYTLQGVDQIGAPPVIPFPRRPFGNASMHLDFKALNVNIKPGTQFAVFNFPLPAYRPRSFMHYRNRSGVARMTCSATTPDKAPQENTDVIVLSYTTRDKSQVKLLKDGFPAYQLQKSTVHIDFRPTDNALTGKHDPVADYSSYLAFVRAVKPHLASLSAAMTNMFEGLTFEYCYVDTDFLERVNATEDSRQLKDELKLSDADLDPFAGPSTPPDAGCSSGGSGHTSP